MTIFIVLLLVLFAVYKFEFFSFKKQSLKFDVALIQSALNTTKTKKHISKENKLNFLDEATFYKENEKLFTYILKKPIISSKTAWIKEDSNKYSYDLKDKKVLFEYKNFTFSCIDEINLCKEFE